MADIKYLPIEEFRRLGYLQEANRQFFHPHGLALEVRVIESDWSEEEVAASPWMADQEARVVQALTTPDGYGRLDRSPAPSEIEEQARDICRALWPEGSRHLSGVWDYRDDPEGIFYGDLSMKDRERAETVRDERRRHAAPRIELFTVEGFEVGHGEVGDVEPLDFVYEEPDSAADG